MSLFLHSLKYITNVTSLKNIYYNKQSKVKEKWFHSIVGVLDANTCRAEYYNKKIETERTVTRVSRTKRSSDCAVRGGWNTI